MPPRKIWTGSINFGFVTIPVGLYSATEDRSIQFHQYERDTADRVRFKRVNERTGAEVRYDDIIKGREVDGRVVTVEPSELDEIAPGRSRTIDIDAFVSISEIDPVYFQKTYWLAPNSNEHVRPYALLRQALHNANQAGIATFVLHGKEYLTALRAEESVLALDTLHFAEEIRDPKSVIAETGSVTLSDNEMQMAETIIDSMSGPWQPGNYVDTYTEQVHQLLADKAGGAEPTQAQAPPEPTDMVDLTEALQRSVEEARGHGGVPKPRSEQRGKSQGGTARSEKNQSGRVQRGKRSKRAEPDLSALNKGELAERARQLGVRGRSKMNRDDLERAVASAGNSARGNRSRQVS